MNDTLKGTSTILTGSTSGIDLGVARAFAVQGTDSLLNAFGDLLETANLRKALAAEHGVRYVAAVAGTALAAWLGWELARALGTELPPFITFYPVIILSALLGGTGSGLLATFLSALLVDYLFLPPVGTLGIRGPADMAGIALFTAVNIIMSLAGGALCKARQRTQQQARDLARTNADLEQRVQQHTAKLREALTDLEHMSYSMVHDMRAPLRAMQTFSTFAEEECAGGSSPETKDYFRRIRESARRLDRLVTDALNYNKVIREQLPTTHVDLAKLLRGMIDSYPNLQPSVAEIQVDFHELFVLGNESLLTQVFGSLLGNAVKFVAPGVRPRIRIWADPSTLNHHPSTLINIQDNGLGIPKEAHEKIFLMFQRMHHEDEYPGTGIGLAIVRKAAKRMGGQVGLESEPGAGSRFWVHLSTPAPDVLTALRA